MTDISKAAVDVAANVLRVTGEHYIASLLTTLRAALDEAEAERDAANAVLRQIVNLTSQHGGAAQALKLIRTHLGAKP